jgi:hypothetical protein
MSDRYATVTILAEDERSANLLRRYVHRALDIGPRQIRQLISPSGQGDAKHWVLRRYGLEVKELRRKHHRVGLVVHLDADNESVDRRHRQLAEALEKDAMQPRADHDRVSHAIPRRHTETWLCILTGIAVNEERNCKKERMPAEPDQAVKPAADALYALTRPNATASNLPSLASAVPELRRLEFK